MGYKLELNPTEEQIKIFEEYFNACRFIYNWALGLHEAESNLNENGYMKKISYYTLSEKLTQLRKEKPFLERYLAYSLRVSVKDLCTAMDRYLNSNLLNNKPIYRRKKAYYGKQSFGTRCDTLYIHDTYISIADIGEIELKGKSPIKLRGCGNKRTRKVNYIHYMNPRIVFNGCKYYLSFTIEEDTNNDIVPNSRRKYRDNEIWQRKESTDVIGIDFGCKKDNWLVSSNGTKLNRPDTSKEEKKIKKLQRKLQRQLKVNNKRWEKANPSSNVKDRPKTKNEIKTLLKWNKIEKHKTNKKLDAVHCYLSHEILADKPKAVVIEDIKTKDMLLTDKNIGSYHRNNHNHMIYESMPYTVRHTIAQKMSNNNIPVIIADKEYPSTQLCSNCGNRMDIGKKRTYICPICGMIKNRDENASDNLKLYGRRILENVV